MEASNFAMLMQIFIHLFLNVMKPVFMEETNIQYSVF